MTQEYATDCMIDESSLEIEEIDEIQVLNKLSDAERIEVGQIVAANEGLVRSVAVRYCRFLNAGLTFEALLNAGRIGCMIAARKFDSTRGYRFSTMARWWIRQQISKMIGNEVHQIRIPTWYQQRCRKAKIACHVPVTSMDKADKNNLTMHEKLSGTSESEHLSIDMRKAIDLLPDPQRGIIKARFFNELTLDETAVVYSRSREWIRLMEIDGLDRLKEFIQNGNLRPNCTSPFNRFRTPAGGLQRIRTRSHLSDRP